MTPSIHGTIAQNFDKSGSGQELLDRLRARAAEFRRLDAHVDGATLIDEILAELEPVVNGAGAEILTIAEAAARSGYSQDHIGRLLRKGTLENVGKARAPRVLAGDLPRKPAAQVAGAIGEKYSPASDARFLRRPAVRSKHGS
jgi:hypothetical protein